MEENSNSVHFPDGQTVPACSHRELERNFLVG